MNLGKAEAVIKLDIDNLEDLECAIGDLIADKIKVSVNLVLKLTED